MKTWVLGAVLGVPGLVALVACGSSNSCPAGQMSVTELGVTVCAPVGTGAGTTTTGSSLTTVTSGSSGNVTTVTNSSSSGSPATTTSSSSSGGNGGSGAGGSTSGGSCTAPAAATDCGTCANQGDCQMCLDTYDPNGATAVTVIIVQDCGCASGSACYSACGTDPACPAVMMDPSQACIACLNGLTGSEACYTKIKTDCAASTDCKQFATELQNCSNLPM